MSKSSHPLIEGLRSGLTPPREEPIPQWAEREVYLPHSQYGTRYVADAVPAHAGVFEAFQDSEVREIAVVGPTGWGKTSVFEVCHCYIVSEDPGETLHVGQTDVMAKQWVKSRMRKVWESSPCSAQFIPNGGADKRDKYGTMEVIFRHMNWWCAPANETALQEKSVRYFLGDEPWNWGATGGGGGLIGYGLKRHHDRWNRKALLQSQAGVEESEWHEFSKLGKWHDYHHRCPKCRAYQPFRWDMFQYDTIRDGNEELDWPAIYESVRLKCQHCAAEFRDTVQNRRRWAQGEYRWNGNRHVEGRVTFNPSFLTAWGIAWTKVVEEWLLAQEAKRIGNLEPLQQVINQRFAQFWEEPSDVPVLNLKGDPYRKQTYHDGQAWEGEDFRFLAVDVQKGHFWVVVRAWKLGGESRLLWEGRVETWENIRHLQERFRVENRCVFVDARYDKDAVAKECITKRAKQEDAPWNMLMGEDSQGYMVKLGKRRYLRTYSNYVSGRTADGVPYQIIKFSNLLCKNKLAALMDGDGWGVPVDVSRHYKAQIQSEKKVEVKPGKWRWEPVKKSHSNNHLWDCEVMGITAACIFGVLDATQEVD